MRTINLPNDYEGIVNAILIDTKGCENSNKAVLYIHGFNDYFFHDHVSDFFHNNNYRFYALDLRKCGRSYLPHQHFNYCRRISEYFPEITESIRQIEKDGAEKIILMGHSMGGLIASIYANEGEKRDKLSSIILNSPFLEFNMSYNKTRVSQMFASLISAFIPYSYTKMSALPLYARSIYKGLNGEWDFDTKLRPLGNVKVFYAWFSAIYKAHQKIKNGLNIHVPILCLSSDHSYHSKQWSNEAMISDTVSNVEDIKKYSQNLGSKTTYIAIPNALHDVFLSQKDIRDTAFQVVNDWLARV